MMRSEDLRNKEGHARPEDNTRGGSAARVGAASFRSQGRRQVAGSREKKVTQANRQMKEKEGESCIRSKKFVLACLDT